MEDKVVTMLEQYISTIIGDYNIKVEIIEDTVVLYREERWHCYIIPERFTVIGCLVNEDIDITNQIRKEASNIYHTYEQLKESETI